MRACEKSPDTEYITSERGGHKVALAAALLRPYLAGMDTEKKTVPESAPAPVAAPQPAGEQGGPKGPEPTRYGDWEQKGRCTDF